MTRRIDFQSKLTALVGREAAAAYDEPDRLAMLVEWLCRSLGFVVAMACRGDADRIEESLAVAAKQAQVAAFSKAPFARMAMTERRVGP
jgi:hypothetical protein